MKNKTRGFAMLMALAVFASSVPMNADVVAYATEVANEQTVDVSANTTVKTDAEVSAQETSITTGDDKVSQEQIEVNEGIKIEDYFKFGTWSDDDATIQFMTKKKEQDLPYFYIDCVSDNSIIKWQADAYFSDGTSVKVDSGRERGWFYNGDVDYITYYKDKTVGEDTVSTVVDYYVLWADLYAGDEQIGSIRKKYNVSYIGLTKEEVQEDYQVLSKIYDNLNSIEDKKLCYQMNNETETVTCSVSVATKNEYSNFGKLNCTWIAKAADGTEKTVETVTNVTEVPEKDFTLYQEFDVTDASGTVTGTEVKRVDKYILEVSFVYDGEMLITLSADYETVLNPIEITSETGKFKARQGERKHLTVEAVNRTNSDIGTLTYQWYTVSENGVAIKMEGETTNETYVTVDNYDISYKCVVSATNIQNAYGVTETDELVAEFIPVSYSGFRVSGRSNKYVYALNGEKVELYVETEVDSGYELSYRWEKVVGYGVNDNGEFEVIKGADSNRYVMEKVEDTDYDDYRLNVGYASHRVCIDVLKDGDVKESYYYYFDLEHGTRYSSHSNSGQVLAVYGQDVELSARVTLYEKEIKEEYNWYSVEQQVKYIYDSGYKLLDSSQVIPDDASYDYVTGYVSTAEKTEAGKTVYVKKWCKELEPGAKYGSVYVLKGKDASGNCIDTRGMYVCKRKLYKEDDSYSVVENYYYTVYYKTELSAYAKNDVVSAKVGDSACLEVEAQTMEEDVYSISYQWQKYSTVSSNYVDIPGATKSAYDIDAVTAQDFGKYRVKVSDLFTEVVVDVTLTEIKAEEVIVKEDPIFYTPEQSYYNPALGDSVKMEVRSWFPEGLTPSYTWYASETNYNNPWDMTETIEEWQILGEKDASYILNVNDNDDYNIYKCEVVYKKDGSYVTKTFYFNVEGSDFTIERLVPEYQYKKLGDSVSFGVRVYSNTGADYEGRYTYTWYQSYVIGNGWYSSQKIDGATEATYRIDNITQKDFNYLYCDVYDNLNEVSKRKYFYIRLHTDVSMESSSEKVMVNVGDNVVLAPTLLNPSREKITYQWKGDSGNTNGYTGIIYGETEASYTIKNIGENEFGTYYCDIYVDGIYWDDYRVVVSEKGAAAEAEDTVSYAEGYASAMDAMVGERVSFKIDVTTKDKRAVYYQWYCGEKAIGGATEAIYTIDKATFNDEGSYKCVVTDVNGDVIEHNVTFSLDVYNGFKVESGCLGSSDYKSYEVKLGGKVVLTANAVTDSGKALFYQWYQKEPADSYNSSKLLYKETSSTLTLNNITADDLGYYYCQVTDGAGSSSTLYYYVYLDTGLVTEPSIKYPVAAADGSVTMYVDARADAGYAVKYQWIKFDKNGDFSLIPQATSNKYRIPRLTEDAYGAYMCIVYTAGEYVGFEYIVEQDYAADQNKEYVVEGGEISLTAKVVNPKADKKYTYVWYEQHLSTEDYERLSCTSSIYTGKTQKAKQTASTYGYNEANYRCYIYEDGEVVKYLNYTVNVIPTPTYVTTLPETSHPFEKRVDTKAYKVNGASSLTITLDRRSESILVVDNTGSGYWIDGRSAALTIPGDTAIFFAYNDYSDVFAYGYKVASINPKYTAGSGSGSTAGSGSVTKAIPAKNSTYTVGNLVYKVTKSAASGGTVAVSKAANKKLKSVVIPATVTLNGYTFNVTEISAKAFKGCNKMTKVTIGKNVSKIGKSAFSGCNKVKTVTIKTTKLTAKNVGAKAFSGINEKAKIKVPKKKLSAYKKFLKKKGVGKKAKIVKG